MTSEQLNIPESVADFIEGRTPKSVGARHYMLLKRKAMQFYPRYRDYLTLLRSKLNEERINEDTDATSWSQATQVLDGIALQQAFITLC